MADFKMFSTYCSSLTKYYFVSFANRKDLQGASVINVITKELPISGNFYGNEKSNYTHKIKISM